MKLLEDMCINSLDFPFKIGVIVVASATAVSIFCDVLVLKYSFIYYFLLFLCCHYWWLGNLWLLCLFYFHQCCCHLSSSYSDNFSFYAPFLAMALSLILNSHYTYCIYESPSIPYNNWPPSWCVHAFCDIKLLVDPESSTTRVMVWLFLPLLCPLVLTFSCLISCIISETVLFFYIIRCFISSSNLSTDWFISFLFGLVMSNGFRFP